MELDARPFTRSQDHALISPKPPLENTAFWRSGAEHPTTCSRGLSGCICAVPTGSMLPHYLVCGTIITYYWIVNRLSPSFQWFLFKEAKVRQLYVMFLTGYIRHCLLELPNFLVADSGCNSSGAESETKICLTLDCKPEAEQEWPLQISPQGHGNPLH